MSKRVLFIAYYYPPLAGSGVYRPLKLVEYMREFGYYVDVLTVDELDYHTNDSALLQQSQANNIYRANSYDPLAIMKKIRKKNVQLSEPIVFSERKKRIINSFFPIDNKIGWLYPALKKSNELFKIHTYDMCFATIGPFTSALLASKIAQKHKIPYVIDYRDHWTLNTYKFDYNPLNKVMSKCLETKILKKSMLVSCVGKEMRTELVFEFLQNTPDKVIVCYNGYDEKEFKIANYMKVDNKIIIRYMGTFNANRTVKYFATALQELIKENYDISSLQFEFYGNFDSQTVISLQTGSLQKYVQIYSQIPHVDSISKICSADVLLLFISSEDGKGVLTGKLFEYIRSGKMILPMIRQDGEAKDILNNLGYHKSCSMEDIQSIKKYIKEINEARFDNLPKNNANIAIFTRESQCLQLINEIDLRLPNKV
ncbi:MAG: hypothetical protein RBS16_04580 [Candidatus Cloacimonadales bacterium]|jgi:glycosyltransferase involved in cell wall biosynthesis|nr:hypothetical protein [Candidatus Cloacimonadales bacterium]